MLEDWTAALTRELGVDGEVDVDEVLDLARVAAHHVARPAAPLTTFLVGYAAALSAGGLTAVPELAAKARRLAEDYAGEDAERQQ